MVEQNRSFYVLSFILSGGGDFSEGPRTVTGLEVGFMHFTGGGRGGEGMGLDKGVKNGLPFPSLLPLPLPFFFFSLFHSTQGRRNKSTRGFLPPPPFPPLSLPPHSNFPLLSPISNPLQPRFRIPFFVWEEISLLTLLPTHLTPDPDPGGRNDPNQSGGDFEHRGGEGGRDGREK